MGVCVAFRVFCPLRSDRSARLCKPEVTGSIPVRSTSRKPFVHAGLPNRNGFGLPGADARTTQERSTHGTWLWTPLSFLVVLPTMRRELAGWFALLALASGCSGSEASSDGQTASEPKPDRSHELRRPLHVPTVAPGEACPRTPGGRPSPDVAIALGSGPAYPVLGFEGNHVPPSPKALVPLYADERRGTSYWHKTLWAVDPTYDGPVLIRGAGIDPPRAIRFAYDRRKLRELEFPAQESSSWRYGPSITIVPGPGCYAFQVDGTNFSKAIVFEAKAVDAS